MQTFKIKNIGIFMTKLLTKDIFDSFLLEEAKLTTANSFTINGRIHPEFYSEEERSSINTEFSTWESMRQLCYEIIKGKNTPLFFSLTLHAPASIKESIISAADISPEDLKAALINIRYDSNGMSIITGISLNTFTLDKSAERLWDKKIPEILSGNGIDFEIM